MVWIKLFLLISFVHAADLPVFLTKHSIESLRYISMDGRYAYVQKRPGVLGLVSSFKSTDFLSEPFSSDFIMKGSRFKERLIIEVIPNTHAEYNLYKNNKLLLIDWGGTKTKEIGLGQASKLHLQDEWISYFNAYEKLIYIHNVVTDKKFEIRLTGKASPFYVPEVEMITQELVVYTDINDAGLVSVIAHNLSSQKSTIIYKSSATGTRMELCQQKGYLALGEFPYEGLSRGTKIMQIKVSSGTNIAGHTTIYESTDQDIGNMVCMEKGLYFMKSMGSSKSIVDKTTDAAWLDFKSSQIAVKSSMGNVTQLLEMDGRVLLPFRGAFYVIEGSNDLGEDRLKSIQNDKEELPLEI